MLNHFINDIKIFSDFNNLIKDFSNPKQLNLFTELVRLVFVYHPIYNDFVEEYYETLPNVQNSKNNLHFILTKQQKLCSVQVKFDDDFVFDKEIYQSNKFYKHFLITNLDKTYTNSNSNIYITGYFFNMIKPEWFTFVKYKLLKQLHIFPQLTPSDTHIILINNVIHSNSIEHEFSTDLILNHFWINQHLNSKITIISVETIQQLIRIFNDLSYQKMINNTIQHFVLVGDNKKTFYNGVITVNEDFEKEIQFYKNNYCNLTIIVTHDNFVKLMASMTNLNIIPDLLITYPPNNNILNDILQVKKTIFISYTPNSHPDYSLSNNTLIKYNNEQTILAKFKKTNIMDYLEIDDNDMIKDFDEIVKMDQIYPYEHTTHLDNTLWLSNYNKLFQWMTKYNTIPKQCSTNTTEMLLFIFMYEQIIQMDSIDEYKYQKMKLLPLWDSIIYKDIGNWEISFNLLVNWVKINKRIPNNGINTNFEEYWLYNFIELQQFNYKANSISEDKMVKIEEFLCITTQIDLIMWDLLYKHLKLWIMTNNTIPNLNNLDSNTKTLGLFVDIQKQNKYLYKLNDKQIKKLELLPLWNWEIKDCSLWMLMFNKMLLYMSINVNFPNIEYTTDESIELALFMDMQKRFYTINLLSCEQINKLESLSFWVFDNVYICNKITKLRNNKTIEKLTAWEKKYNELLKWYELYDYAPRRNMEEPNEKLLNYFIDKQKKLQKQGQLSEYKIKKLELLPNWNWISQKNINIEEWNNDFVKLSKWMKLHNRMPKFDINNTDEKKMFEFCNEQIICKLDGKLDTKKIKKLESLKYWTWLNNENPITEHTTKKWYVKYEKLVQWVNTYNKYPQYGTKDILEENLVTFIYNNRYLYNKHKLNSDQITKLELLPNWVWHKN